MYIALYMYMYLQFIITKKIELLSSTRRCFNGIVIVVEVNNHIMKKYAKGVRHFDSLRVFIKHAHEQYDVIHNKLITVFS